MRLHEGGGTSQRRRHHGTTIGRLLFRSNYQTEGLVPRPSSDTVQVLTVKAVLDEQWKRPEEWIVVLPVVPLALNTARRRRFGCPGSKNAGKRIWTAFTTLAEK